MVHPSFKFFGYINKMSFSSTTFGLAIIKKLLPCYFNFVQFSIKNLYMIFHTFFFGRNMKKGLLVSIIATIIISSSGTILAEKTIIPITQSNGIYNDELNVHVSFPEFQSDWIQGTSQGQQIIIDGFDSIYTPNCPALPMKNFLFAIPPDATFLSLHYDVSLSTELPNTYQISSALLLIPYTDQFFPQPVQYTTDMISNSDDPYPPDGVVIQTYGSLRYYPYISICICPFTYYPVSGRLLYSTDFDITIQYETSSNEQTGIFPDLKTELLAESIFTNYDEIQQYYQKNDPKNQVLSDTAEYLIITTEDLVDTIQQSNFILWKDTVGHTVRIITVTDSDITSAAGSDLAAKIRNFLRSNYLEWGIQYVLLVGDYQTVPMRYCYPNPSNHQNTAGTPGGTGGEVPTDYYYADLSNPDETSWDDDGDGYYGEYGQDHPDFLPEVYVGRIPVNDPSRITYALNKIVSFEHDTGEWKHHALAPGAFFYFTNETAPNTRAMDGARTSAVIADTLMVNWTVSRYTEQEGLEVSAYPGSPLTESAWTQDWKQNQYAIVNWAAHGWSNLIARKVWSFDDGDHIPEANEISWPTMLDTASNLDDDYPSIVTAISCYVGYPEPNNWGNLGIDLLTQPGFGAAVGVISSARSPYGNLDWPTDLGGSDSIIYEFNNNIINHSQSVGEAFYQAKFFCNLHYGWNSYEEYIDLFTFNLYGDPSLMFEGLIGDVPQVTIVKPTSALYFLNQKIFECKKPFIIGAIDVEVTASDNGSGIAYVQFMINGELQGNVSTSPYSWRWDQRTFGKQTLTVRVYNMTGSFASDELLVRKFF
jgi:hypothetical protein